MMHLGLLLPCMAAFANGAHGPAPLQLDASIAVRVEPDRRLVPGEIGRLVVSYANKGPDAAVSMLASSSFFESFHRRESVRFFVQETADECSFFIDYPGSPNQDDIHYYGQLVIRFGPMPPGTDGECTLGFRVGAEPEPFKPLTFDIGDGQRHLDDPVPEDNTSTVQLLFYGAGERVQAIPSGTAGGWLMLGMAITGAAAIRRARARKEWSRRRARALP